LMDRFTSHWFQGCDQFFIYRKIWKSLWQIDGIVLHGQFWHYGKNGGYPKTQSQIQAIVENKSRCPNENEYQTILNPIFLEEDEYFKKEYVERMEKYEQRKENERLQQEAAKAAKRIEMAKICKGVPKINQDIIENVSIAGRIDPGSIRLNRVHVTEEGDYMAVFYTSIGIALAPVGFNANGVIVSNQRIAFPK
jgi:hypothetical protein